MRRPHILLRPPTTRLRRYRVSEQELWAAEGRAGRPRTSDDSIHSRDIKEGTVNNAAIAANAGGKTLRKEGGGDSRNRRISVMAISSRERRGRTAARPP